MACLFGLAAAANLLPNPSFELGVEGLGCTKFLRLDTNPGLTFEGLFVDTQEHVSGRQSVCLSNRFAEATELSMGSVLLQSETSYTFSAWLKSSEEDTPCYLSVYSRYPTWRIHGRHTLSLGRSWRAYSFTFKTEAGFSNLAAGLRFLCGVRDRPATIWFDDFQLEAGALTPMRATGLEAAVRGAPAYFFEEGRAASVRLMVKLVNHDAAAAKGTIRLVASREGSPEAVRSRDLPFEVPQGSSVEMPCDLRFPGFGRYQVRLETPSGAEVRAAAVSIVVAGKYTARPISIHGDFCVGLNLDARSVSQPGWMALFGEGRVSAGLKTGAADETNRDLLAAMGARLLRLWDTGFTWADLEPEEGRFEWGPIDRLLDFKARTGIELLPVLGGMDFVERDGKADCKLPPWLRARCTVKDFRALKRKAYLPPLDAWRRYVRAIAAHAKGRLRDYEIMNEPNIIFPFEEQEAYLPYLRAAREELDAAAPGSRVVGPCTTSDLGGKMLPFCEAMLKAGAGRDLDVLSFHPYDSPELGSPNPADRTIESVRGILRDLGPKRIPIWNTELYYLHEMPPGTSTQTRGLYEPRHAAARFLVDLGEGLGQSVAVHASSLFPEADVAGSAPSEAFIVYNVLARHFEGARPVLKRKETNGQCIVYGYERGGRGIVAAWDYGSRGNRLELGSASALLRRLNLFGNPLPIPSDGVVSVGQAPSYFEGADPGLAQGRLLAIFREAKISPDPGPLPGAR
ncbi:MAG: hypothetical protein J0L75_11360 [Spirochaetes bacterium]|nr:hypothetical protein [Spirochaetota bacterium]